MAEMQISEFSTSNEDIFHLVFGDSDTNDDSDNEDAAQELGVNQLHRWKKVSEVKGLWHCNHFLSTEQQTALTKAIATEGWFARPQHNQAMRFGDLPVWALELCDLIRHSVCSYRSAITAELQDDMMDNIGPLPSQILEREPLFDQMIANSYQPGEGIKAHVDLLRFEDGIAIVSLESTCVMSFALMGDDAESLREHHSSKQLQVLTPDDAHSQLRSSLSKSQGEISVVCERDKMSGLARRVDVLLKPGDLIISSGPARYLWTHEINRSKDRQVWLGQTIEQHSRISVTLRRLCPHRDTD